MLFGGGRALDFGRALPDGQRILGDHKTVRGVAAGFTVGCIVAAVESQLIRGDLLTVGILASLGALLGDLAGAFVKRRLRIAPGGLLPGVDQLDFVVGAVILVSLAYPVTLGSLLVLILVTPPIHLLTNVGAYSLRLKSHYW